MRVEAQLKILNLTRGDPRTGVPAGDTGATLSPTRDPWTASLCAHMSNYVLCFMSRVARLFFFLPLPPQCGTTLHSRYRHCWWRVAHSSVATVTAGDGTTRSGRQMKGLWRGPTYMMEQLDSWWYPFEASFR